MSRVEVCLPILTPKQLEINENTAKNKVLVEGRRFGKTTLFADKAVNTLLDQKVVLEAAPISRQTNAFWKMCKDSMRPLLDSGAAKKWETERIIEFGNGFLQTQTAWDADSFRGGYADLLLIDEYSLMKNASIWEEVGAPMLMDTNGDVWFAFTPQFRNFAHSLYLEALSKSDWAVFHGTSWDNPYLSRGALERAKRNMPESAYRQEIMAEFLEGEGAVFRNIAACIKAPDTTPEQHRGHYLVAGVDWAKQSDYTCVSIGCVNCHSEVARDRFNQIDYIFQRSRLERMLKMWDVRHALLELNSIGEPNFEELSRAGFPVSGFTTTASSKPPLIENLALCLEAEEWQFQDDRIWTGELEAYERKVSATTGRSQYSAPEGMYDDTVMARALMVWASRNRATIKDNPFDM